MRTRPHPYNYNIHILENTGFTYELTVSHCYFTTDHKWFRLSLYVNMDEGSIDHRNNIYQLLRNTDDYSGGNIVLDGADLNLIRSLPVVYDSSVYRVFERV